MFETSKIDSFFSGEKNFFEEEEKSFISRRTKVVRFFKLFLPCLTAILLGLGVALFDFDATSSSAISMANEEKLYFEKFKMKNTVFEITEKDNQFSILKADEVEEKNAGEKIYDLINPDANTLHKGKFITLRADIGAYDQNKKLLNLNRDVQADYNKQMLVKTSSATYNFDSETGFGNDKIIGTGEKGNFVANKFTFDKKNSTITLIGDVELYNDNIKLTTPNKATLFSDENKFVADNATVIKENDKLKGKVLTAFFKDTKKFELDRAITEGNTEIYSNGKTAFADKGEYIAETRIAYLYDNVKIKDNKGYTATSENGMYNFDTKKITLNNNVKITKANNTAITDKAIYYQDKDEFHLIGNVKISQQGTTASANKGIYFVKKNIVELLDNVVIERNGNVVRGDKAISDFNTSKSKLIAQKGGRISGKLIENKLKD